MKISREFTEATVLARIQERAGFRYQSSQLATYFGVSTAIMSVVLSKLATLKQIRRVRCACNPTMYYVPTQEEREAEERLGLQEPVKPTPLHCKSHIGLLRASEWKRER